LLASNCPHIYVVTLFVIITDAVRCVLYENTSQVGLDASERTSDGTKVREAGH